MHIAIIGCGNMGTGLAERLSSSHSLLLYDRKWPKTEEIAKKFNAKACENLKECLEAELLFIAVKPQNIKELAKELEPFLKKDHIVVSLLAGTPLETLRHYLPNPRLIRMMPNLALRYGAGVIGLVDTPDLSIKLKEKLEQLCTPLGMVYWLEENKIEALTALTGSGPAFIFILIETMIESGIAMGFTARDAQLLTYQMLQGSLTLLKETHQHPAELKWQVASPAGTTIEGIRTLEQGNVRSGIIEAFLAAYNRSRAMNFDHQQ